jgi:hypothetical protein
VAVQGLSISKSIEINFAHSANRAESLRVAPGENPSLFKLEIGSIAWLCAQI